MARKLRRRKKAHRRTIRNSEKAAPRGNTGQPPLEGEDKLLLIYKTVDHFFPFLGEWLDRIHDPRDPHLITYPLRALMWSIVLMFFFHLPARRRLRYDFNSPHALDNYNLLTNCELVTLPHPDTPIYPLGKKKLSPDGPDRVRVQMARSLLRGKVLTAFRLFKRDYFVAMDATGIVAASNRHCPHCLHGKDAKGRTYYYHMVLEAKLVCSNGLVMSLATEFIQNTDGETMQDCELKAFYRLLPRLHRIFPQLPMCLLLDSIYLNQNVLRLLRQHHLHYITTFKEGSLPLAFGEFETLHSLVPHQSLERTTKEGHWRYRWVSGLVHEEEKFNGFECVEALSSGEHHRFLWATNLHVNPVTVEELAKGGRLRWKIENEGFRTQKHGGYQLEHVYVKDWNAAIHFYILLQIAHLLMQLVQIGSLLPAPAQKLYGSFLQLARELLEAWRTAYIEKPALELILARRCRISLRGP